MRAGGEKAEPRRITLTARNVVKLRPSRMPIGGETVQQDYIDKDGPTGLRVRTSSSGRNVYHLRYRLHGRPMKH